jgi:hypothetical protein
MVRLRNDAVHNGGFSDDQMCLAGVGPSAVTPGALMRGGSWVFGELAGVFAPSKPPKPRGTRSSSPASGAASGVDGLTLLLLRWGGRRPRRPGDESRRGCRRYGEAA